MKIYIPPFEPALKANEHLRRPGFELDLGEDITQVVRCKDCEWRNMILSDDYGSKICSVSGMYPKSETDYCSYGERK